MGFSAFREFFTMQATSPPSPVPTGALSHLKVLDLSRVLTASNRITRLVEVFA